MNNQNDLKSKVIFIAGTGTGVGKTAITGLLAHFFSLKGFNICTQKWIQTGLSEDTPDIRIHDRWLGKEAVHILKGMESLRMPYAFQYPASADLASRLEKKKIEPEKLIRSIFDLRKCFNPLLIEGAGGILVPVTQNLLFADLIQELNLPVLLVSANCLGSINQTLLTLSELKRRKISVLGIVFNQIAREKSEILKDNPLAVENFSEVPVLGTLPFTKNRKILIRAFQPIAERILNSL